MNQTLDGRSFMGVISLTLTIHYLLQIFYISFSNSSILFALFCLTTMPHTNQAKGKAAHNILRVVLNKQMLYIFDGSTHWFLLISAETAHTHARTHTANISFGMHSSNRSYIHSEYVKRMGKSSSNIHTNNKETNCMNFNLK